MSPRAYRIIAAVALSAAALFAPAAPPHFFAYLISSARLALNAAALQTLWQWLCIAAFYAGALLVGSAPRRRGPDSRDATIKQLSEAVSSYAAANSQWEERFQRIAAEWDELAAHCAEITAERDCLANQLGQARGALARGAAFPRKFTSLFKHPLVIKAVKVAAHPDKAKSEAERKQREAMTKLFLEFVDYVARQEAAGDFSAAS